MRIGSLFSGYGGLEMGVQSVIGGEVAWHVEFDPAPSKILAHRFPGVPNYGDITKVDWSSVEPVDVLTGGFPCQDVSLAGLRRGLRDGTRSGLWFQFAVAIHRLRPRLVVIENVRGLLSAEADWDMEPGPWGLGDGDGRPALRAIGAVLGDLANLGYDARWCGVRAADAGAPHGRYRVFIVAKDTDLATRGERWLSAPGQAMRPGSRADAGGRGGASVTDAASSGCDGRPQDPQRVPISRTATAGSGGVAGTTADTSRGDERRGIARFLGSTPGSNQGDRYQREWDGYSVADRVAATRAWGPYAAAVTRWESVIGRVAPSPTEPTGKGGAQRLSPMFVEWMMGLPNGWLTAPEVGLTRAQQLKALGNGVVPQQAALAVRTLLQAEEMAA